MPTAGATFHMQDCSDKKCPLSRTRNPDYRPTFERHVARKALHTHPSRLVYASFGSGLLQQDYQILELIAKEPQLRELSVHLIDALYVPPNEANILEDDNRIHEAALDFAARIRALSSSSLSIRVLVHPSVPSYLSTCKTSPQECADVLVLADCGPEVQTSFLLLAERGLKPTGRWFVLFKYADGSKEEITDKRLPTAVAAMLYSRGHQQHCCIVSGRQDVKRRPKLFDLANVAAANPHLWLQFPAVADEQQKWEHRNLLNCKIAMLAFEQWNYNYTFAYGAHPPKAPMAAAPLSKRELWLRKLLKSGASASQEADKATPLHWAIMGASQPDATEERIVTMLLKAGAKVDVPAAMNRAERCVSRLLEAGANPNALNANNQTALHISCLTQHVGITKLLLAKGAQTDIKDSDGDTALACARAKKNAELVKLLTPA